MLMSIFASFGMIASMMTLMMQRHHLLMALLSLEVMMLTISLFIMFSSTSVSYLMSFILIVVLTLVVCEASMALACLIIMSRSKGSIFFSNLNVNKF